MSKIVSVIVSFLLITIGSMYLLLFTNSGNKLMKPYIGRYLSKKYKTDIKVDSFTLRSNFLDTELRVNKNLRVIFNGDINILKRDINLDFFVRKIVDTKENQIISGKIFGKIDNFDFNGKGGIFGSKVKFDGTVKSYETTKLRLDMKRAKIGKILKILGYPAYCMGVVSVDANLRDLKMGFLNGEAKIAVPYGSINSFLVKKDLNITLPKSFIFNLKSDIVLKKERYLSKIDLTSNIFKLHTFKTEYDIKNNFIKSDYSLDIADLSLLDELSSLKLRGEMKIDGEIEKDKSGFKFDGTTFSLGGITKIKGDENTIDINAQSLSLKKILYMVYQPRYADGELNVIADIDGYLGDNVEGKAEMKLENGRLDNDMIKKDLNITINKVIDFRDDSIAWIKSKKLYFQSELHSNVANAKLKKGGYDMVTKKVDGVYNAYIKNLSDIDFLMGVDINASAEMNGKFEYFSDLFYTTGKVDMLNSVSNYEYKNGDLVLSVEDLMISKLLEALGYRAILEADTKAQIFYTFYKKKGVFRVIMKNPKIARNALSDLVYSVSGMDLTKERFSDSTLNGNMDGDIIKFSYDLTNKNTLVKIYSAKADMKNRTIEAKYIVKIADKDIEGEITGEIDNPDIKINSSSYIKNKIKEAVEKKVSKKIGESVKKILELF